MARRSTGFAIGIVFGFVLCWSGMASPEVIRKALLFEQSYLFLFMFSAIAVAAVGTRLVTRQPGRPQPLREKPQRRHIVGALIFGLGWGVADACPGPVLTQVGQGTGWALFTFAGVLTGVWLFHRHSRYANRASVSLFANDDTEFSPAAARLNS
jgi:uncharacterized membrane protein YedE/YeeE